MIWFKHLVLNRTLSLVPLSQSPEAQVYSEAAQLATYVRMTNESKASRSFVHKPLLQLATCAFEKWQNLKNCNLFLYRYSLIAGNSSTVLFGARYKIGWNHGTSDEQTRVLLWFTAPTSKVALGIAGLARHGINKLVQAASADPTTEFCSILSVSSSWWSWQKCIEWDHRVSLWKPASQTSLKRGSEITKVRRFKSWPYLIL